ncbi:hypothetical protein K439DRAFT_1616640 [Ramaria rubella]|nr:hypothetical protein K439DRAFT_1616640 [Ramaria rubella]
MVESPSQPHMATKGVTTTTTTSDEGYTAARRDPIRSMTLGHLNTAFTSTPLPSPRRPAPWQRHTPMRGLQRRKQTMQALWMPYHLPSVHPSSAQTHSMYMWCHHVPQATTPLLHTCALPSHMSKTTAHPQPTSVPPHTGHHHCSTSLLLLHTPAALCALLAPCRHPLSPLHAICPPPPPAQPSPESPRTPAALLGPTTHSCCPPILLRSFCAPPPPLCTLLALSAHPSRPFSTLRAFWVPLLPSWPPPCHLSTPTTRPALSTHLLGPTAHSRHLPGLLRSFCVPPPPFIPSTHPSRWTSPGLTIDRCCCTLHKTPLLALVHERQTSPPPS